jgi:hypothetical protein
MMNIIILLNAALNVPFYSAKKQGATLGREKMRILIWGNGFETIRDVPNYFDDKEIGEIVLNEFGEKAFANAWGWTHTDRPVGNSTWDPDVSMMRDIDEDAN